MEFQNFNNDKKIKLFEIKNKNLSPNFCSSVSMVFINDRKAYSQATTCIINHILKANHLNNTEKLYYLLANLHAQTSKAINGIRTTEKSGKEWGRLLNRSEQHIFQMQKNLERLGYFLILREKDEDNQNEKNIITPTLPDKVFDELMQEPNRANIVLASRCYEEKYKLSYLDASKMFIKLNLPMFQMVLKHNNLSSLQKLIWVYFFSRSYIAYNDKDGNGTRNFITNYQEISTIFSCNESTVSLAIKKLYKEGFVTKKQFRIKDKTKFGRRKKKSCWEICALIPEAQIKELLQQKDRQNLAPLDVNDIRLYGSSCIVNTYVSFQAEDSYFENIKSYQPIKVEIAVNNESIANYTKLQTNNCNLYNSYNIDGAPYETMQYNNNKNNILNIKNNVNEPTSLENKTNLLVKKDNNVFSEKEFLLSDEELALALDIVTKFDEEVFKRSEQDLKNLEEIIRKQDLTLTAKEHWLVTKAAFTLHQKLQHEILVQYGQEYDDISVIKLKENLFTFREETLLSLWESFSDLPAKAEKEEFLIRKSWLLKLLPNYANQLKNEEINQKTLDFKPLGLPEEIAIPDLPGDKTDKAKKFAKKLLTKKLAKGYSASLSVEDLAKELIYHAANWVPRKLKCRTREEEIDAALSFAWKAVEQGKWQCPYRLLSFQIQQRELEAAAWKNR